MLECLPFLGIICATMCKSPSEKQVFVILETFNLCYYKTSDFPSLYCAHCTSANLNLKLGQVI